MLLGLVPGFGAGAYLLAKPLRAHPVIPAIILDRLLRKLPAGLYRLMHLLELTTWWARPPTAGMRGAGRPSLRREIRERFATLEPFRPLIAGVLAVDMLALFVATFLHFGLDVSWAFSEFGFMNTINVAQLLTAGVLGLLSFRLFWLGPHERAPHSVRSGIFLWGAMGLGLTVFAFDDFFGVHERLGGWIAENANVLPVATNNADDIMTLMYGAIGLGVLAVFRHELFALRASSALLVAGVLAAGVMLATDAFAPGDAKALEFPAQVGAVGILLLALLVRYLEVRSSVAANASPSPESAHRSLA